MSLEEVDLDQPIDGLNHGEREHLDEWHFKFKELKGYPILGRLATPPSTKVISRAELLERGTGTCAPSPGRCCAEHVGVKAPGRPSNTTFRLPMYWAMFTFSGGNLRENVNRWQFKVRR